MSLPVGYTSGRKKGITTMACVKTAISIEESLLDDVKALAGRMKISRSQLFARAVREFMGRHNGEEITRRLNEIFTGGPDEETKAFTEAAAAQLAQLTKDDEW